MPKNCRRVIQSVCADPAPFPLPDKSRPSGVLIECTTVRQRSLEEHPTRQGEIWRDAVSGGPPVFLLAKTKLLGFDHEPVTICCSDGKQSTKESKEILLEWLGLSGTEIAVAAATFWVSVGHQI